MELGLYSFAELTPDASGGDRLAGASASQT